MTDAEFVRIKERCDAEHCSDIQLGFVRAHNDAKALLREVERLRDIIDGALAHRYGPYSDKELLRRVVAILWTTKHKAAEAESELSDASSCKTEKS